MSNVIKPTIYSWEQNSEDVLPGTDTSLALKISPKESEPSGKFIKTNKLYPLGGTSPHIATTFSLLDEVVEKLDEAIEATENGDTIGSDNSILHIQSILPELFCCRSIGEGFAAIINAVYHGINNHGPNTLFSEPQLVTLRVVMNKLSEQPFMQFDEGLDLIMKLEDNGFEVEPDHYSTFEDIADA